GGLPGRRGLRARLRLRDRRHLHHHRNQGQAPRARLSGVPLEAMTNGPLPVGSGLVHNKNKRKAMNIPFRSSLPLAALLMLIAQGSWAKVPGDEAQKLGNELTCFGAEQAANAHGSIPAFAGQWLGTPPGVKFAGV